MYLKHIYLGAYAVAMSYRRNLPIHIVDLNCTGSEETVLECAHNNLIGVHVCDNMQDAAIRCQGQRKYKVIYVQNTIDHKHHALLLHVSF